MIHFFRRIRKQLLGEGKTGKYLKYAIGEILLVMIGILLALQVNNWNEGRKIKDKEIKSLHELRSELMQNLSDINSNIIGLENCKKSNEIIHSQITKKLPYNDSLDYHFSMLYPYITFSANQTTYENLKLTGMNLVTNDSIRSSISDLYANRFKAYRTFENTYFVNHYFQQIHPMLMTEFSSFEYRVGAKPINYDNFINNSENKQTLNFTIDICKNFIAFQSTLGEEVQLLIEEIDAELDNK